MVRSFALECAKRRVVMMASQGTIVQGFRDVMIRVKAKASPVAATRPNRVACDPSPLHTVEKSVESPKNAVSVLGASAMVQATREWMDEGLGRLGKNGSDGIKVERVERLKHRPLGSMRRRKK